MQSREITITGRYLNMPVKAGAPRCRMCITIGGQVVRAFHVELAADEIDFWTFIDVSAWQGQSAEITLEADSATPDADQEQPIHEGALDVLELSEEIKDAAEIYQESLRPQFHFTTRRGWHNDPNGMVYFEGEYHLFYQHQPFSVSSFTDKSWGHAVSRDLLHWEERPIALYADHEGQKWSGSGVVDWHNVSGLKQGEEPPLLLFYTATGLSVHASKAPDDFVQSIAYSNDRGHTWETYAGNPIIPTITHGNRDPLVQWHEPTQRWVMTLFVGQPASWLNDENQVAAQIFTSANLIEWHYESTVDGFFDCPVLLSLPLDGDASDLRWVMYCADMKYKVGRFDGRVFTPETDFLVGQRGDCAYAPQLFNNAPDDRRIQIAWGRTKAPGMPFSQIMNFPCDLSMITTEEGPRMRWTPVKEIENLYQTTTIRSGDLLAADGKPLELARGRHFDLHVIVDVGDALELEINVGGILVSCVVEAKELRCAGCTAPLKLEDGKLNLRLLLDRICIEIFAESGLVYMPLAVMPDAENDLITIRAKGGAATVETFEFHELKSIWPMC